MQKNHCDALINGFLLGYFSLVSEMQAAYASRLYLGNYYLNKTHIETSNVKTGGKEEALEKFAKKTREK